MGIHDSVSDIIAQNKSNVRINKAIDISSCKASQLSSRGSKQPSYGVQVHGGGHDRAVPGDEAATEARGTQRLQVLDAVREPARAAVCGRHLAMRVYLFFGGRFTPTCNTDDEEKPVMSLPGCATLW
jgi:hypothetical protein